MSTLFAEPTPEMAPPPIAHPSGQMLLACDIDSVFLAGDPQERLHLYQLISRHPDIQLVFITARAQALVQPLLDDPALPPPQYLICDAGATIVGTDQAHIAGLQAALDALRRNEHAGSVNASRCLSHLVQHLGLNPASVLVVTPSLNAEDFQALLPEFYVTHVDNSGQAFAHQPPGDFCALQAQRTGCGAVLEAMAHFGFFGEEALNALNQKHQQSHQQNHHLAA